MKKKTGRRPKEKGLTASEFIALPDVEKNRIVAELEAESPERRLARSRPLNAREIRQWDQIRKRLRGRPKLGEHGTLKVSVSIEQSLMARADAFAKRLGLKRSELFAASISQALRDGLMTGE